MREGSGGTVRLDGLPEPCSRLQDAPIKFLLRVLELIGSSGKKERMCAMNGLQLTQANHFMLRNEFFEQ
jgi:hypothetical protein